ncbi:MAG: hypothetical protein KDH88_13480 [Chromatiales bacterium]|nr:hypothetical protein [Chromatiales bacterium]
MGGITLDPDSNVVSEHYAVVKASRRQRNRFPEGTVTIVANAAEALAAAEPEKNRYAARVAGPSRSSEGLRLYYLVRWLED